MNDITLPTMTKEERRLLLDMEHRKPALRPHIAWWIPVVIVFLFFCMFMFAIYHKPNPAAAPVSVMHTIGINPDTTYCYQRRELLNAKWTPTSSEGERNLAAADRRKHVMPSPTLTCVDTASCNDKPAGCELTTVTLGQWWYETARLPARRVSAE